MSCNNNNFIYGYVDDSNNAIIGAVQDVLVGGLPSIVWYDLNSGAEYSGEVFQCCSSPIESQNENCDVTLIYGYITTDNEPLVGIQNGFVNGVISISWLAINGMAEYNGTVLLCCSSGSGEEATIIFSIGLTRTVNTVTANLSTGKAGSQSVIGGTGASETLTISSTTNATKGKILFGTSAYDEVNNRLGIGQTTPISAIDITTLALGVTQLLTAGLSLNNTTPATLGAQQISPATYYNSFGFKTDSGGSSVAVSYRIYLLPVQGASNPTAELHIQSSVAGSAYSTRLTIANNGDVTVTRLMTATIRETTSGNNYVAVTGTTPNQVMALGNTGMLTTNFVSKASGGTFNFDNRVCSSLAIPTVASANDLTLTNGNVFHISGTTQINAIVNTSWNQGAIVVLIFDGVLTVKNNTSGGASTSKIQLSGSADFATTANDTLTLLWDGANTVWRELARSIN